MPSVRVSSSTLSPTKLSEERQARTPERFLSAPTSRSFWRHYIHSKPKFYRKCHCNSETAMAALPRQSLRSSTRRDSCLDEPPATAIHHNTSPDTPRQKRAREPSSGEDDVQAAKKQKLRLRAPPLPKVAPTKQIAKALSAPSSRPVNGVVTQPSISSRITNAVQSLPNGVPPTTQTTQLTPKPEGPVLRGGHGISEGEKRKLRSQDGGSRSKSELSLYFPNYEDLVSVEPKETGKIGVPFFRCRNT